MSERNREEGAYGRAGIFHRVVGDWIAGTIASGQSASGEMDLGDCFEKVQVVIENCAVIQSSTTGSFQVARVSGGTYVPLWKEDASAALTSGTLPTSGGWGVTLAPGAGFRYWKLVLSKVTSGGALTFYMCGVP